MSRAHRCALFSLVTVIACADGETTTAPPVGNLPQYPSTGFVTADVDGSTWTSAYVTVRIGGGVLRVTGSNWGQFDNPVQLDLIMQTSVGPTPQLISPQQSPYASFAEVFYATWLASDDVGKGSITLTSLTDDRAQGTFSFTGHLAPLPYPLDGVPPRRVVTNGRFDVPLR